MATYHELYPQRASLNRIRQYILDNQRGGPLTVKIRWLSHGAGGHMAV
jgi:hypothetical protein